MANGTAYFPILKSEKQADGTLKVWGKATGPDLDLDDQVCDPTWLKSAMPSWMQWGNVREQHTSIAAGVGLTLEQDGDSWNLETLVVDPGSVAKVDAGVLKGYSIGIRNPKIVKDAAAPGGRITGGTIVEVSLVDRPANPTCTLMLAKAAKDGKLELVKDLGMGMGDVTGGADPVDEAAEVSLIVQVRDALTALLVGEAAELAAGGEAGPVWILLQLLDDLTWFETADAYADAAAMVAAMKAALTTSKEDIVKLSTVAELVKAATADGAPAEDLAAVTELRKALGIDDVIETATKSATDAEAKASAAEETVKGLAADLAKARAELDAVKEMAAPGSPVRVRTEVDRAVADHAEKAAHYEALADRITDPKLREGYQKLAAQTRAAAPAPNP